MPNLASQTRILDGDDGLRCEILHQRNLLVSERAHLFAVDGHRTKRSSVFEHRHHHKGAGFKDIDKLLKWLQALDVCRFSRGVRNMFKLLCLGEATERSFRINVEHFFALSHLGKGRRHAMQRDRVKALAIIGHQDAETGLGKPRRLLQRRLENGSKVAWRGIDDLQYLGGRSLLLQCLARLR